MRLGCGGTRSLVEVASYPGTGIVREELNRSRPFYDDSPYTRNGVGYPGVESPITVSEGTSRCLGEGVRRSPLTGDSRQ